MEFELFASSAFNDLFKIHACMCTRCSLVLTFSVHGDYIAYPRV